MYQVYRDMLTTDEGIRTVVYDDATGKPIIPGSVVVGHPTIGIGRALDVTGLAPAEITHLFDNDITRVERALATRLPFYSSLNERRKFVLVSIAFNTGIEGLMKFRKMLDAVQRQAWDEAAGEIIDSDAARQLPERYGRLASAMRGVPR